MQTTQTTFQSSPWAWLRQCCSSPLKRRKKQHVAKPEFWKNKAEQKNSRVDGISSSVSWHFMAFHGSIHELTGHFAPVSDGGLTVDVAGQGTGAQRWNSNTRFYGFEIDFVFFCKSVRIYNFVGRHQSVTWSISKNISQKKQLACHTRRCCKHAGVAARSLSEKHFAWQVGSKLLSNSLLIDSLPGLEWGLQMDQAAGSWDWEV